MNILSNYLETSTNKIHRTGTMTQAGGLYSGQSINRNILFEFCIKFDHISYIIFDCLIRMNEMN